MRPTLRPQGRNPVPPRGTGFPPPVPRPGGGRAGSSWGASRPPSSPAWAQAPRPSAVAAAGRGSLRPSLSRAPLCCLGLVWGRVCPPPFFATSRLAGGSGSCRVAALQARFPGLSRWLVRPPSRRFGRRRPRPLPPSAPAPRLFRPSRLRRVWVVPCRGAASPPSLFFLRLVLPPCAGACCPRLSWGSPFLRSRLPRGGSALSAVRVRPASCAWVAGSPLGRSPCGLRGGGRSVRRGYAGACAPAFCAPPRRCFAACARAAMPVGVGRGCSSAALAGGVVFRVWGLYRCGRARGSCAPRTPSARGAFVPLSPPPLSPWGKGGARPLASPAGGIMGAQGCQGQAALPGLAPPLTPLSPMMCGRQAL